MENRRRFVEGLAVSGAVLGAGNARAADGALRPSLRTELLGRRFFLDITCGAVNITGNRSWGYAINGRFPAPLLRWREGDDISLSVTNHLAESTSIHWHGIRVPNPMDGVPGLVFPGIAPGETFVYRFPVRQYGTYWYHSHSGYQEQKGHRGPLVIERRGPDPIRAERDYVVMLTDWSDTDPRVIASNLKQNSNYYSLSQRTFGTFADDGASDPPARAVERVGERQRHLPALQAHGEREAGRGADLSRHRRCAGPLGVSLPSPLPFRGRWHVPHRPGFVMSKANIHRLAASALIAGAAAISMPALAESANQQAESPYGYDLKDEHVYIHGIFDQLEGRLNGQTGYLRWDGQAWAGTDENKIWLKTEGRYHGNGKMEDGDQELLYDTPISRFIDFQVGARYDLDSLPGRAWAAIGVEGLAPEFVTFQATLYVSSEGHYAARLEGSYDLFLTQLLVAQPQIEINMYSKPDPGRLVDTGLSDIDAGFRLRYEISRKFAPYIGVTDYQQFGGTGVFARQSGSHARDLRFVVGIRTWF